MFKWLRDTEDGLAKVQELFTRMLVDGRHVFDVAMSARVGGADPAALSDDLLETESRTDELEREIRRRVLVHASVRGAVDMGECLMYMSISKDAERIADLSKNLFGIAETVGSPPKGPLRSDLIRLKDTVSPMITEAATIFAEGDGTAAEAFIERARELQEHCRTQIDELLRDDADAPQPAASALTYRHISRICSNLLNIVSAVVVPLDQLDYPGGEESEDE
jgi:phosphate uptake regulator